VVRQRHPRRREHRHLTDVGQRRRHHRRGRWHRCGPGRVVHDDGTSGDHDDLDHLPAVDGGHIVGRQRSDDHPGDVAAGDHDDHLVGVAGVDDHDHRLGVHDHDDGRGALVHDDHVVDDARPDHDDVDDLGSDDHDHRTDDHDHRIGHDHGAAARPDDAVERRRRRHRRVGARALDALTSATSGRRLRAADGLAERGDDLA
jgi:hypothetical protein